VYNAVVERRTGDRRTRESRIDVTRLEHEQLHASVEGLTEAIFRLEQDFRTQLVRIAQLQQEINQLKAQKATS
jgi:uncharacterized coiled-coil DUF342 family protein